MGLQAQLVQAALRGLGQRVEERQPLGEVTDRFDIGRALHGAEPGPLPVTHGGRTEAGLREVMGEQLGLRFDGFGKPLDQYLRDPLVILLPVALQQRLIGGILNERMPERVDDVGGQAPPVEQSGLHELR